MTATFTTETKTSRIAAFAVAFAVNAAILFAVGQTITDRGMPLIGKGETVAAHCDSPSQGASHLTLAMAR